MTEDVHEVKIPMSEPESKGVLAKGKGLTETVIKEKKPAIPSETPGRDVSIKPRSPYREFKGEAWNRSSSERYSEESVRVNDKSIRSVYEIRGGGSKDSYGSPNHAVPKPSSQHVYSASFPPPNASRSSPHMAVPPGAIPYYFPQGVPAPNVVMPPPQIYSPHPANIYSGMQVPTYHYPMTAALPLPPNAMPDYDSFPEELEKDARLKFKSLFSALKIKYPDKTFDEYDPDMPLRYIHQTYVDYKRNLSIESNASIVKIVLIFIFLGIDFVCRKWLGFDSSSFTKSQLARIKSYESMINEISAVFVGDGNSDWPLGIRFAFLLLFNAALFVGVSYVCVKMGIKDPQPIINMVNNVMGNSVDEVVTAKPPPPVDPVTNTTELPRSDPLRNLMGNAQTLLAMAGQTLKPGTDVGDVIGNLGASAIERNVKPTKPAVKFGNKN